MAKGYPDYFGQSIFPHYGPMQLSTLSRPLAPNETFTYVGLTLKGVLAFATIHMLPDAWIDLRKVYIRVYVNGVMLCNKAITIEEILKHMVGEGRFLKCVSYDRNANTVIMSIPHEINFTDEFKIELLSGAMTSNVSVEVSAFYYYVTS